MARPVDIAHVTADNQLVVTWDDGQVSRLPVPYLRAWCPCAGCQGHGVTVRYRDHGSDVRVQGLYEMGAYALGIRFSDGHDTGIYTWQWLRAIAPESPPRGLKRGTFDRGTFVDPS